MLSCASVAVVLAFAAELVGGLFVQTKPHGDEHVVDDPRVHIVDAAISKLQDTWPNAPPEMLAEATRVIPPLDQGVALQDRLRARLGAKETFLFAAFGSSVTAGHDNLPAQGWPFELERFLQPTFQALGFDVLVRQRAAGGYGEMPFAAGCLTRGGTGVDALSWEFSMYNDAPCEMYHFLSEASKMESKPVIFAFADTALDFDVLAPNKDERKRKRKELLRNHDDEAFNDLDLSRRRSTEWYFGEDFVSKAEVASWKSHGDVKGRKWSPPENYMTHLQMTGAAQQFESAGLGLYPVSVAASTNYVVEDPWYQAREKAFNVNWHPGPLGHTLIASQVAYYILAQLRTVVSASSRASLSESRDRGPSLDNPLVGKPLMQLQDPPSCGNLTSQKCFSGVVPSSTDAMQSLVVHGRWNFLKSNQVSVWNGLKNIDQRWVFSGTPSRGEISFKLEALRDNQYALFCGAPCGWHCEQPYGYVSAKSQRWWNKDTYKGFLNPEGLSPNELNQRIGFQEGVPRSEVSDLEYTVDGTAVRDNDLWTLHDELFDENRGLYCPGCKNPADICQPVAKLSKGEHEISLKVRPRSFNDPDMYVEVLQIMIIG